MFDLPIWAKIMVVGGAILGGAGVKYLWPNYKDDNSVEELIEDAILAETGIEVDITPFSPEK